MALCFLFTLVFTYPVMNFPLRISIHYLAFGETDTSPGQHVMETLIPFVLCMAGAVYADDVGLVFSLIGSVATGAVFFLFPTAMYWRSSKIHTRPAAMLAACACVFALGTVVMICGLIAALAG